MALYTQDDLINFIKEADLKVTNHRLAVLQQISKARHPIASHILIEQLKKKYNIDQATVYRNLSSLHEVGILRRLDFNHGHAHYEIDTGKSSNQFVCSNCETIEKIEGVPADDLLKKMMRKSRKFKTIQNANIEIYGLCKSCG